MRLCPHFIKLIILWSVGSETVAFLRPFREAERHDVGLKIGSEVLVLFNKNPKETEGKTLKSSENEQISGKKETTAIQHTATDNNLSVPKWLPILTPP